jgi:hypothetical protein
MVLKRENEVEKMDFEIEEVENTTPKHPGCTTVRFTVGYL